MFKKLHPMLSSRERERNEEKMAGEEKKEFLWQPDKN
jgi:hypothetical protein